MYKRQALAGEPVDDDPASAALREDVAAMLSGGAEDGTDLAHPAIAYVVVHGDRESRSELMSTLDSSPLLEKVTEGSEGGTWRVIDALPRAVVTGGEEPIALDSGVVDAQGEIAPAEEELSLIHI